jgi:hypothetical protein
MISEFNLRTANDYLKNGNYIDALKIYEEILNASPRLFNSLKINIDKCRSKIGANRDHHLETKRMLHDVLCYDVDYFKEHYKYMHNRHALVECHSNNKYIKMVINEVEKMAEKAPVKVLSFDVFDTVLLRHPACESTRFWTSSNNFAEKIDKNPMDLFIARYESAKTAYSLTPIKNANREGEFKTIAKLVCDSVGDKSLFLDYVNNELQTEFKQVQLSNLYSELIKYFTGLKVIFVSDMYLESEKIEFLLNAHNVITSKNIFSSADGLGSKRGAAKIFNKIESIYSMIGENFIHIGDNFNSDYKNAIKNNWGAVYLPVPTYEKSLRLSTYENLCNTLPVSNLNYKKYLNFNM